jgi:hypothetical protein
MTACRPFFNLATGEWIEVHGRRREHRRAARPLQLAQRARPRDYRAHPPPPRGALHHHGRRSPLHPRRRRTRGRAGRDDHRAGPRPPLRGKPRTGRDPGSSRAARASVARATGASSLRNGGRIRNSGRRCRISWPMGGSLIRGRRIGLRSSTMLARDLQAWSRPA